MCVGLVFLCRGRAFTLSPEVKLIPNGCDVLLHRRSLPGLKDWQRNPLGMIACQEVWWKHRFHFSLSEGFFEFVEEQMQLENGRLA